MRNPDILLQLPFQGRVWGRMVCAGVPFGVCFGAAWTDPGGKDETLNPKEVTKTRPRRARFLEMWADQVYEFGT